MKNLKRYSIIALVVLSAVAPASVSAHQGQIVDEPTLIAHPSLDEWDENVHTVTTPPLYGYTWSDLTDPKSDDDDDGDPPHGGNNS